VHDPFNSAMVGELGEIGSAHDLLAQSAFNRHANGDLITGPASGASNFVAAMVQDQPVAVPSFEFYVPQAVGQALGRDFFDVLIEPVPTAERGP
jgi:hypothetical protein